VYGADLEPAGVSDPRVTPLALDVRSPDRFRALVDEIVEREGRLDLLINNAGVGAAGEVRDATLETWRHVIDVNTMGVVHGVDAVYRGMVKRGSGQIINIASGAGLCARPGMVPYATSKAAVIGLSNSLRTEAALYGIRVTCACPGFVATGIMDSTRFEGVDGAGLRRAIPLRAMSSNRCATLILRAAERNRAVVPIGLPTRLEWCLTRFVPILALRIAAFRATKFQEHRTS
jgi:short-subunit dehydrogenase